MNDWYLPLYLYRYSKMNIFPVNLFLFVFIITIAIGFGKLISKNILSFTENNNLLNPVGSRRIPIIISLIWVGLWILLIALMANYGTKFSSRDFVETLYIIFGGIAIFWLIILPSWRLIKYITQGIVNELKK
ncbi:hypothetical protein A2232_01480 [candidate division WOR-1 bacterium RIFOXYA2_FULL_46_56]|uniref:Uncharacterized protein n=1 Tax=candidate division WOR-1 bacterium RIFOXYC2_FULL_46_14 TaxID=1802587 RepID=A0A1F4U9G7_UNCSA|nr:MAG: hypothetical protein A2292_01480 [candidate division WOR-1 bacterium RIFOXYB2_FULL_46_45]OGC30342.1 MAG: hypothetical protein A2232_01480 [candidate division WOR-1 bacterium RIFOXYA2_FULL_46_56]OGC40943.1 MAG: hypothetical protein A2438_01480 [candidate division WOR-1 bacterium RIFOXYC2_FULL_46_14]